MDELVSGREPWSRRRRLAAVAAVLLVLASVIAERAVRDTQLRGLAAAVEQGEQAVRDSRAAVRSVEEYQAALASRADLPAGLRRSLQANVKEAARRWEGPVADAAADVRGLRALPWHDDVAAGRDAYAERLDAWRALLSATGASEGRFEAAADRVNATRRGAREALRDALGRAAPPLE